MADTIFALATAQGRAGISVVRISGPQAFEAAEKVSGRTPEPGRPALRWLRDPHHGTGIDRGLVLAFRGPASFTGEDVVELQLHGGTAIYRSMLAALAHVEGLRLAQPGEFTRRALTNGRLDLAQVEGLGDLIAAETASQQRQALRMMEGTLSRLVVGWGERLLHALAFVEASIDFVDEELPGDLLISVLEGLTQIGSEMRREIAGSSSAERIRDGFEVVLVGPPNVGKSTLANAIAGRDVALTSEVAGTTRDAIEVRLDLGGLAVTLTDTAGLRKGADSVEALGVARARNRAEAADLRVFLVARREDIAALGVAVEADDIVVRCKADLPGPDEPMSMSVSGLTGAGVDRLLASIAERLAERAAGAGAVSHARQRDAVEVAERSLARARTSLAQADPQAEIVAEEIRSALRALDFVLGKVDVEAVLDVVFRSFCIGK